MVQDIPEYIEARTRLTTGPILVTGGTGFIGAHLIRQLVALGVRVHVLVRPGANPWRLAEVQDRLTWHEADLTDHASITSVAKQVRPAWIFHLAAMVDAARDPSLFPEMWRTNCVGTWNLLSACSPHQIERCVCLGSLEEYGSTTPPFDETQREIPVSPYGLTKCWSTHLAQWFYRVEGCPVVVLRAGVVYGPGQLCGALIPEVIRHCLEETPMALTPGEQRRDFTYVSDVIDAAVHAAYAPNVAGEIINVGTGIGRAVRTVAVQIRSLMGSKTPLHFGQRAYRSHEIMNATARIEKAQHLLGWSVSVSLDEGLRHTIQWYHDHATDRVLKPEGTG